MKGLKGFILFLTTKEFLFKLPIVFADFSVIYFIIYTCILYFCRYADNKSVAASRSAQCFMFHF